ncbi:hypothetical protein JKP88DRAFT_243172 [Tribonema minus]|uniref:ATPase domain-containing protein n=1 Tax=Tribonema minus TaxID=303371 RepID=A0A835ZAV0_9STRA|nr:hypothetical protein JKP88DRAFT_243172 [Tribonema minus]
MRRVLLMQFELLPTVFKRDMSDAPAGALLHRVAGARHAPADISDTTSTEVLRQATSASPLFDRVFERSRLDDLLRSTPQRITVMLGPRSCGKIKLVVEHLKQEKYRNCACYVDCRRVVGGYNAEAFAEIFAAQALPPLVHGLPKHELQRFAARLSAMQDMSKFDAKPPAVEGAAKLASVFGFYLEFLEAWQRLPLSLDRPKWPVLVIDAADMIARWKDESEVQQLINFLATVMTRDSRAHVLLMASAHSGWFQTWMGENFRCSLWRSEVVGNFSEDVARAFLERRLAIETQSCDVPPAVLSDDDWKRVYNVSALTFSSSLSCTLSDLCMVMTLLLQ